MVRSTAGAVEDSKLVQRAAEILALGCLCIVERGHY